MFYLIILTVLNQIKMRQTFYKKLVNLFDYNT